MKFDRISLVPIYCFQNKKSRCVAAAYCYFWQLNNWKRSNWSFVTDKNKSVKTNNCQTFGLVIAKQTKTDQHKQIIISVCFISAEISSKTTFCDIKEPFRAMKMSTVSYLQKIQLKQHFVISKNHLELWNCQHFHICRKYI